jgi:hypothetical protein
VLCTAKVDEDDEVFGTETVVTQMLRAWGLVGLIVHGSILNFEQNSITYDESGHESSAGSLVSFTASTIRLKVGVQEKHILSHALVCEQHHQCPIFVVPD